MTILHDLRQDIIYAVKALRRAPAFSATAVITLALGMGMATAAFSVVNGVLLRPLPYADSEELVNIWNDFSTGQSLPAVTAASVRTYRERARLFEEFSFGTGTRDVFAAGIITSNGAPPERVQINSVSANFLPMLNGHPILGRHFTAEDEDISASNVVLISHALWQRRYGADSAVVGTSLEIDGTPYRIEGVLPPDFRLLLPQESYSIADADVYAPVRINWANPVPFTIFTVFGRMKDGVSLEQARADLDGVAQSMRAESPRYEELKLRVRAIPLRHDVTKSVRSPLLLLLSAAGLLVVAAGANVANLLLARATTREREVSIRVAIGASRWRITRQLATEGLVLAMIGAACGLVFAIGALELLSLAAIPLPRLQEVTVDWTVVAFVAGLCVLVALAFALAPALHALRDVRNALTGASRSTAQGSQPRLRNALVVGEIALSLVLLVTAGLLVRSLVALQGVSPGFEASSAITFNVALPRPEYLFPKRIAYSNEMLERLRGLPGVTAVGASSVLPFTGQPPTSSYQVVGSDETLSERMNADRVVMTEGYLRAAGTRLLAGRDFLPSDNDQAPPVVMVDERIASREWPNESAIGKRLRVSGYDSAATVIGVVEQVRLHSLTVDGLPLIYMSHYSRPQGNMHYFVRTSAPLTQLSPAIASIVKAGDPDVPASNVMPLETVLGEHLAMSRLNLVLMQTIGVIALLLAAVGLYGVISFVVGQRRREFAVRLALGETSGGLSRLVLRRGLLLIGGGITIGVIGAVVAGRLMGSVLFGVSPHDPLTIAVASIGLALVAAGACYVPAMRAGRVEPAAVLRTD